MALPATSTSTPVAVGSWLQAKAACSGCASGPEDAVVEDQAACSSCASLAPAPVQRARWPGHDFSSLAVEPLGPGAGRAAALELEADRTADRVLARLARPGSTPAAPTPVSAGPAADVQRQADPEEAQADAEADAALEGPALEPAAPDDDSAGDDDEPVQAKAMGSDFTAPPHRSRGPANPDWRARLSGSRGGGGALPTGLRRDLDAAFGADFGQVRIHADAHAAGLARDAHALAFTSGRDIYFAAGQFDAQSQSGRRLLAHELTHVLQQGAADAAPDRAGQATGARPAAPLQAQRGAVQCAPDPAAERTVFGKFIYFDAAGEVIVEATATQMVDLGVPPGYYEVKVLSASGADELSIEVVGVGKFRQTSTNPKRKAQVMARTARIFLLVYSNGSTVQPGSPPPTPSADDPTGPSGGPDPAGGGQQPGTGDKPGITENPDGGTPPVPDGKSPGSPSGSDSGSGKTGGQPGLSDEPAGKDDKSGLPGEKKGGSKYGVFALLDLPQPLIDFLEGALEVLGDSAEMESMSESLRMLKDLAEHQDALAELFKDPQTLLEIALGLKESAAIDAIEAWASREVPASKKAKGKHKGVAALAAKLIGTVGKLRKVIKPIFKVRQSVQSALAGVGMMLEAVPALEGLLEMAADPGKVAELDLLSAADDFAVDFAAQVRSKLEDAPKALKAGITKLGESDLVSYEELAAAVTAAILAAVPKHYKPVVKVAKGIGLDGAISDNVIAPIIPKSTLDGVNGVLRVLIAQIEPTLTGSADDLQKIIDDLAPGFLDEMPAQVRKVIKPSMHGARPARRASIGALAQSLRRSTGTPLDDDTRSDAETRMGHDFGRVSVHTDAPARAASDGLGAKAFAIGSNIYFGSGQFNPASASGQRLLFHELAHTAQQASSGALALQPDYKDLLKRLSKRFSASVIAELQGATTTSPAKQKQVTDILDKVEKLRGRKVLSRTNPKLPTGYSYIPKDTGKIKTIRRSLAWIRFVPALTIDGKRRIQLTATLSRFDPKAAARRALRAALGCKPQQQAHHIVPLELFLHDVVKLAVLNGFKFNGQDNGLCITEKVHSGSHPVYSGGVRSRLDNLWTTYGNDWAKIQPHFDGAVAGWRTSLAQRKTKLK